MNKLHNLPASQRHLDRAGRQANQHFKLFFVAVTILIALICSTAISVVSQSLPIADYDRSTDQSHVEKFIQAAPRDDQAFAQLFVTLHDCKTSVHVNNGKISSDYLQSRGYSANDQDQKGYVIFFG